MISEMTVKEIAMVLLRLASFTSGALLLAGFLQAWVNSQRVRVMMGLWMAGLGAMGLLIVGMIAASAVLA